MDQGIQQISLLNMSLAFLPMVVVLVVLFKWQLGFGNALYAIARMLLQLLVIGYLLVFIFNAENAWIVLGVLTIMLIASSWIALRTIEKRQVTLFGKSLVAMFISGSLLLVIVTQAVLDLDPWYNPQYMVPLAGMVFANAMTALSLAAERLFSELENSNDFIACRNTAYQASMIPVINSMFAVGLVSLPGMMTGQILSGVSPLIAVRYQIVVMCMIFSCSGIASAIFLALVKPHCIKLIEQKQSA